jgi:hypothetical protein
MNSNITASLPDIYAKLYSGSILKFAAETKMEALYIRNAVAVYKHRQEKPMKALGIPGAILSLISSYDEATQILTLRFVDEIKKPERVFQILEEIPTPLPSMPSMPSTHEE